MTYYALSILIDCRLAGQVRKTDVPEEMINNGYFEVGIYNDQYVLTDKGFKAVQAALEATKNVN